MTEAEEDSGYWEDEYDMTYYYDGEVNTVWDCLDRFREADGYESDDVWDQVYEMCEDDYEDLGYEI